MWKSFVFFFRSLFNSRTCTSLWKMCLVPRVCIYVHIKSKARACREKKKRTQPLCFFSAIHSSRRGAWARRRICLRNSGNGDMFFFLFYSIFYFSSQLSKVHKIQLCWVGLVAARRIFDDNNLLIIFFDSISDLVLLSRSVSSQFHWVEINLMKTEKSCVHTARAERLCHLNDSVSFQSVISVWLCLFFYLTRAHTTHTHTEKWQNRMRKGEEEKKMW